MEVVSWNFLAETDSDRILYCAVEKDFLCKCGCSGRHTTDVLFEVFSWSMLALFNGRCFNG